MINSCVNRLQKQIVDCDPSDSVVIEMLQRRLRRCFLRRRVLLERRIASSSDNSSFHGYVASRLKIEDDLSVLIGADDRRITDDLEKANFLCDIFEGNYVTDLESSSSQAVLRPRDVKMLNDIDLSEMTVYICLKNLLSKRSMNPELLPALSFKRSALGLARPLSLLCQRSLEQVTVPSIFLEAWVAPVHKKASRSDPWNGRPISLTSVICKTMDSVGQIGIGQ